MAGYSTARHLTRPEIYGIWSEVYDEQPNPMLSLEERVLQSLLPEVRGRDLLDLGCGTGRWLSLLLKQHPASLTGIDVSPEMLSRAGMKLRGQAKLIRGDCSVVQLAPASADIALASFVVSHLAGAKALAAQLAHVLRPTGVAFISDLHPATVEALGWSRGFRAKDRVVELGTRNWQLPYLVSLFEQAGLSVTAKVEAHFGATELDLLRRCGRTSALEAAKTHPAIYILELRKRSLGQVTHSVPTTRIQRISGAHVALGPKDSACVTVDLEGARIGSMTTEGSPAKCTSVLDLSGLLVLPGLINAHDHLDFSLFPRLGRGGYQNFTEWFTDIHRSDREAIAKHKAIPKSTRIWWGALRNLLCGVTTVCHHNPLSSDMMAEDFPVRIVRNLGWAHSVVLDENFANRHRRTGVDRPFVIHLGEGVDEGSRTEFSKLAESGALDDRTIVVHGLGCGPDEAHEMNSKGASLVWCPSSNEFLFGRSHSAAALRQFENVAIGSDSPLTAKGDFLDEIRFAAGRTSISPVELYRMATSEPARILRLANGAGRIRVGAVGDLIAVRPISTDPAATLTQMTYRDVHVVVRAGQVQLASPEALTRLPGPARVGLRPIEIDGLVRWVRAPLGRMFRDVAPVLGNEIYLNGRRVRNVATDWL